MVDGAVCVTMRVEIAVRTTAVTDDRSAGFDPCIYDGHQSVGGSVRNGNEKRSPGLALTELALVDLYGRVRTADLLRAALLVQEHGLSAELAPFCERIIIEAMLSFGLADRYVVYDVVCKKHNLLESEVSMLKP